MEAGWRRGGGGGQGEDGDRVVLILDLCTDILTF